MNKQEIYAFLAENGVWHEITEHKAVFNMAELAEVEIPHPEGDAKNLFLRDDKKRGYYLLTVRGDKRVDLKQFRRAHGLRPLSPAYTAHTSTSIASVSAWTTVCACLTLQSA